MSWATKVTTEVDWGSTHLMHARLSPRACLCLIFVLPTCVYPEAGAVELAHVEVEANDGEHEDGKKEQQANL